MQVDTAPYFQSLSIEGCGICRGVKRLCHGAAGFWTFKLWEFQVSLALVDFKSRFRFEAESKVLERTVARRTVRNNCETGCAQNVFHSGS